MGACESSNADGKRKARGRGEGLNKNGSRRAATKMPKLKKADLDSSSQMDEVEAEDEKIQVLRRGQRKELKNMIEKYKDDNDINDYMDQNRTLLLEAVINCPNPEVMVARGNPFNGGVPLVGAFGDVLDVRVRLAEMLSGRLVVDACPERLARLA